LDHFARAIETTLFSQPSAPVVSGCYSKCFAIQDAGGVAPRRLLVDTCILTRSGVYRTRPPEIQKRTAATARAIKSIGRRECRLCGLAFAAARPDPLASTTVVSWNGA
jgi:hypothetical protein